MRDDDRIIGGERLSPDDVDSGRERIGERREQVEGEVLPDQFDRFIEAIEDLQDTVEETIPDQQEFNLITFPSDINPTDLSFIDQDEFLGLTRPGVNTINYTRGEMDFSLAGSVDLSNRLTDLNPNVINSVSIRSDDQFVWWLPELNTGAFVRQGSRVRLSPGGMGGLGISELLVACPRVSEVQILGSTRSDLGYEFEGTSIPYSRSTYDPEEKNRFIEVKEEDGYEDNALTWAPESAERSNLRFASRAIYGDAVSNFGITLTNRGDNPVDIIIEATDAFSPIPDIDDTGEVQFGGEGPGIEDLGFGELFGWSRDDPVRVEPGQTESYEIDPWNHAQFRMLARPEGGDSEVGCVVSGRIN